MLERKTKEIYEEVINSVQKFSRIYIHEREEEDFSDPNTIIIFDIIKILAPVLSALLAWNI
ncbi:hypothetical protein [Sphingobacterium daejeonense]|uniref:hypothetical protein n=1 Tax=Sphingobacterium daejeonense TaxID=371142 RepID=UPI0010C4C6F5|nr:hypothetical protein [Sphingobacterium daejeonense]VTQ07586.1 Uncharacterised protein [Sphingobacterium daejeonense]